MQSKSFMTPGQPHPARCVKHKTWKKKGVCEGCRIEEDKLQRQREQEHGANKPEVIIGKI